MNSKELIEKRKTELAASLMQFHPELLTAITSDLGSAQIADRINALIEAHCLAVMMRSEGKPAGNSTTGESK